MSRFIKRDEMLVRAARGLRMRENEMADYDANVLMYDRAVSRIDRDYPDGWGDLQPGMPVEAAPEAERERVAAMSFRAQLEHLKATTIRERTKVKYYALAIEEELAEEGVDPVALLEANPEPTPEP